MPLAVSAMISSSPMFCSPGISETLGIRWNWTVAHESANEVPCDLRTPVSGAIHAAWSRVVW